MPKIEVRSVLLAPLLAFLASMIVAVLAGLFLGFFGGLFIQDPEETSTLFDMAFIAVFVLPAYVICGLSASLLASSIRLAHAAIAGFLYLVATLAMSFPSDPEDPFGWSDALCFVSIVPLSLLGAKIGEFFR